MAETVRVVVRCRPMNKHENEKKCKKIVDMDRNTVKLLHPIDNQAPNKIFTYDSVYDANATTDDIYNEICYPLIENVLEGYNGTIFAYGQTGCGKSYTMQGMTLSNASQINDDFNDIGIISKSFEHIFEAISVTNNIRYLILISFLEIYNENIRDLLVSQTSSLPVLNLKELPSGNVIVQNLSTHTVHNVKECQELLDRGSKNRMCGATMMNTSSSRSHSIFTISLEQIGTDTTEDENKEITNDLPPKSTENFIRTGKLNLVDLAGSERQRKTGATGDRLKEATKINLSLSALGNVISALVDNIDRTKHIPYRDSKLTRLLQDSLGGNTKTLMIACISPASYNYDETLSTLRYASRAKNIRNKPVINEDPKDAMLRKYQEEIVKLKSLLDSNAEKPVQENQQWLEEEKLKLKNQYEAEQIRLQAEHDVQKKEKEELVRDMKRLRQHYDNQMKELAASNDKKTENSIESVASLASKSSGNVLQQQEALNRIETIKNALVGGERANDVQLKEKRIKKKIAAETRLNALAYALSRIEETSDRDLIQNHYSDIQHEFQIKNDSLKSYRQKVKSLEREITDIQSEFQLDRADYLESIRRLERNLKFYQQLWEKTIPILRKDGKYWDPDTIRSEAVWNDDLKKWKLPEESMNRLKLPLAGSPPVPVNVKRVSFDSEEGKMYDENESDEENIVENYFFKPNGRESGNSDSISDMSVRSMRTLQQLRNYQHNLNQTRKLLNFGAKMAKEYEKRRSLSSWLPETEKSRPNETSSDKGTR